MLTAGAFKVEGDVAHWETLLHPAAKCFHREERAIVLHNVVLCSAQSRVVGLQA